VLGIVVSVGQKVKEGDTIATLEAMKMFSVVASADVGTVSEICVKIGESVESKDLLGRLVK
jgi:biotin carboxyl carrier protein